MSLEHFLVQSLAERTASLMPSLVYLVTHVLQGVLLVLPSQHPVNHNFVENFLALREGALRDVDVHLVDHFLPLRHDDLVALSLTLLEDVPVLELLLYLGCEVHRLLLIQEVMCVLDKIEIELLDILLLLVSRLVFLRLHVSN